MDSDRFCHRLSVAINREKNLSVFARKAGLSESSLRGYLHGKMPGVDKAAVIAKAAGVSLGWLVSGEPQTAVDYELNEDALFAELDEVRNAMQNKASSIKDLEELKDLESNLLKILSLNSEQLQLTKRLNEKGYSGAGLRRYVSIDEEEPLDAELAPGFVYVPRLSVEASAGLGREVMPVHQADETIAFQESWLRKIGVLPKNAHALTAVGDSMEPTIRDGDLLLVDSSIDRVRDNGIYVVVVAGMVFVKRLHIRMDGSLVLKSDNPMYPEETIPANDTTDLHVAGRVRWFGRTI